MNHHARVLAATNSPRLAFVGSLLDPRDGKESTLEATNHFAESWIFQGYESKTSNGESLSPREMDHKRNLPGEARRVDGANVPGEDDRPDFIAEGAGIGINRESRNSCADERKASGGGLQVDR